MTPPSSLLRPPTAPAVDTPRRLPLLLAPLLPPRPSPLLLPHPHPPLHPSQHPLPPPHPHQHPLPLPPPLPRRLAPLSSAPTPPTLSPAGCRESLSLRPAPRGPPLTALQQTSGSLLQASAGGSPAQTIGSLGTSMMFSAPPPPLLLRLVGAAGAGVRLSQWRAWSARHLILSCSSQLEQTLECCRGMDATTSLSSWCVL